MKRHIEHLIAVFVVLASSVICATAQPILVIGHKNPDPDSIISAIALANLKTQQGMSAIPLAQGSPNQETEVVLKACKLDAPSIQTSVAGQRVILVDHSDYLQAPADITKAAVVGLVDHLAQLELIDLSIIASRKDEFLSAMKIQKEEEYHSILLMLTAY